MEPFEKYYTLAIQYLTRRPHSEKEIEEYLEKKAKRLSQKKSEFSLTPQLLSAVLKKLKTQKFQSDVEFARWWKGQRNRFRPKSDRVIKMELKQKGITQDIIEQVFLEEDEETVSDGEKARVLVEKRFAKVKDLSRPQQYQKLGAYLARRGFSWDVSRRAIDDVRTKSYNTD